MNKMNYISFIFDNTPVGNAAIYISWTPPPLPNL